MLRLCCVCCMLYTNEKATTCLLNTHCVTKVTSTKLCCCTNYIECFGAIVLWTKNGCFVKSYSLNKLMRKLSDVVA